MFWHFSSIEPRRRFIISVGILPVATYFIYTRSCFDPRLILCCSSSPCCYTTMAASSSASYSLASPQVKTRINAASMNMTGGQAGFSISTTKHKEYGPRLLREVDALLDGRDMVGLTEINSYWYEWLTTHHPSFAAGKFKAFHDGHDCAIVYDSQKPKRFQMSQSRDVS